MIKAIIFDADGVLINAEMFSVQLERDYGISQEITGSFFQNQFMECLEGKRDLKEELAPRLNQWGWKKSVDELLDYWFSVEHKIDRKLVNKIQELRQRGIKCFLATNQEKYRANYLLEKMGFKYSFDKVFFSAHLGHRKPQIQYFYKVMEHLPYLKKEILFWDNETENIKVARSFGWKAEVYTNYREFEEKMEKHLIKK